MDARRASRMVIDPKVRQVGFITPGAPPERTQSVPAVASSPPVSDHSPANTLSPVMIPPPRHASDNLPSLARGIPITVQMSPLRRPSIGDNMMLGSYNPSESMLGTSPVGSSSRNGGEFSEGISSLGWIGKGDLGNVALSLPSMSIPMKSSNFPSPSNLTTVSVVKLPLGMSEKDGKALAEVQNERVVGSKPVKEKTSKAERRALQEAQQAAKAAAKNTGEGSKPTAASGGAVPANAKQAKVVKPPSQRKDGPSVTSSTAASEKKGVDRLPEKERKKDVPHPRMQFDDKQRVEKAKRRAVVKQIEARNRVELFRHLPQYVHGTQLPDLESKFFHLDPMHPAIYKVGLQYLAGNISGGNARCVAMLQAFQDAIRDYSTPTEKTLVRDLTAKIDKVIVRHAVTKIRDGDVLLTYGSSSVVEMILLHAHELGKQFRVVVVDSRPKLEGQSLLRRLVAKGISCTYTHVNAISYIMHEVTRVFLGASSVLSNGTVYSRVGSACVAMVAHAFHVPVIICCEAYKFHERVQLDSICSNELGDPDAISKVPGRKELNHLDNWAASENLQLLNLLFPQQVCLSLCENTEENTCGYEGMLRYLGKVSLCENTEESTCGYEGMFRYLGNV
ncbi:uncharacterized protein LOC143892752 isoform X3 [Tasmannia lanceolata]|uniref:uncharacterized protein LOC143892752 isoform X3 n=1 Tax=Tasmannia lanceolata TaxID=3420 RepID=UPI004062BF36